LKYGYCVDCRRYGPQGSDLLVLAAQTQLLQAYEQTWLLASQRRKDGHGNDRTWSNHLASECD
jgi:hypothetical protein